MTAVVTSIRSISASDPDATLALLTYLGELLGRDCPGPLTDILPELARRFGARGAGIAGPVRPAVSAWIGEAAGFPWKDRADPLWSLADQGESAALTDGGGSWLLWFARGTNPDDLVVLWLNDAVSRSWTEIQSAALALAGRALARAGLLGATVADERLEPRLEHAALVASRLSHDVGNLLTGILGFSELALAQVQAGTRAQRYVQEVWDLGRGGAEWLKKLNYFCRHNPPEFTPTGLSGALSEEAARLGPGQAQDWRADIPADLPAVACDAESLRQALRHVLDNAREATSGREPVVLTARAAELHAAAVQRLLGCPPAGRFVVVTVVDRGPGISPAVRGRLFRDFFFSSKPRHRGMGLMMTYGIVRRFGGGLEVGTAAAGGTEIRLYFPAAPDPVPAGPAQLLVADEDPQVLADARRILEPAGYRVHVAASPMEALALHQTTPQPFELVLLGALLPAMTGPELRGACNCAIRSCSSSSCTRRPAPVYRGMSC